MGNQPSWPLTKKYCKSGSNDRLVYGLTAMQGWRTAMEDAHIAVLDLDGSGECNRFFAAKFAAENVHKRLITEDDYKEQNWEISLKKAFMGVDEDLAAIVPDDTTGSCATAVLVTKDNKIYVANAGDCRSVLSVKGEEKPLSFDHKPTNYSERERIRRAGGYVADDRVNGNLSLSRAFGDFRYKNNSSLSPEAQIITADPEVTCHEITEEDEFLIIACDGIWDCLSSQQVVDIVRYQVSEGKELTEICEMIIEHCLSPIISAMQKGCDNMTLIIVGITHGYTKEGWYKWIEERVKNEYGYKTLSKPPQIMLKVI